VGDWVYVKLQPYRQHSVAHRLNQKLSPRYFGPFPILARVEALAFRLQLPVQAKIHRVFHVSLLKKYAGIAPSMLGTVPYVDDLELSLMSMTLAVSY